MNYPLIDPPDFKDFDEMTRVEAKKHLEWYLNQIPNRLELLRNAFEVTGGGTKEKLDYSVESLRTIWEWFIPLITTQPKTAAELEEETKRLPIGTKKETKLDTGTLAIAMDIGLYFAEVLVRTCKNVTWGLAKSRSKNYINYNRPVLLGFMVGKYETELDPARILYANTLKVAFDGDRGVDALISAYKSGKEKVVG